ncbi:hypothetical protein CEXT_474591 [Caerostris extrusa]|uniref:Uncharacterized protein n=1 Tax=Caerostris extrusa TaxID=172846 RepID=A0AAV4RDD7_CAEEX|nr:hypothetical protein CEXT_474591 [Caerostris extrusa]
MSLITNNSNLFTPIDNLYRFLNIRYLEPPKRKTGKIFPSLNYSTLFLISKTKASGAIWGLSASSVNRKKKIGRKKNMTALNKRLNAFVAGLSLLEDMAPTCLHFCAQVCEVR